MPRACRSCLATRSSAGKLFEPKTSDLDLAEKPLHCRPGALLAARCCSWCCCRLGRCRPRCAPSAAYRKQRSTPPCQSQLSSNSRASGAYRGRCAIKTLQSVFSPRKAVCRRQNRSSMQAHRECRGSGLNDFRFCCLFLFLCRVQRWSHCHCPHQPACQCPGAELSPVVFAVVRALPLLQR